MKISSQFRGQIHYGNMSLHNNNYIITIIEIKIIFIYLYLHWEL